MSATLIGIIGLLGLFTLLAIRTPVAIAMIIVGVIGTWVLNGWPASMSTLVDESFVIASTYELIVIPLFVLMGNFATLSGMSSDLYRAAYAWVGHWRGGLASATIASCAGFAALSGSSVASAVTMGRVALPEMRRYNYDNRLATGCIAAGGTLGILIPPSTGFVIYAILTEESIGRLFLAGVLPGILLTILFMISTTAAILAWCLPTIVRSTAPCPSSALRPLVVGRRVQPFSTSARPAAFGPARSAAWCATWSRGRFSKSL